MQNERLQVLKMVEDGKINVDEATKLLEALKATGASSGPAFEEKFKDFACDMKDFCKDVTCKINEMTKKAEPKVKEFAKTVVSKTADIAENISQSLNEKIKSMEECEDGCVCEGGCCPQEADLPPADNGPRPEPKQDEKQDSPAN